MPSVRVEVADRDYPRMTAWVWDNIPEPSHPDWTVSSFKTEKQGGERVFRVTAQFADNDAKHAALFKLFWA